MQGQPFNDLLVKYDKRIFLEVMNKVEIAKFPLLRVHKLKHLYSNVLIYNKTAKFQDILKVTSRQFYRTSFLIFLVQIPIFLKKLLLQKLFQNPVKHQRWSFLQK